MPNTRIYKFAKTGSFSVKLYRVVELDDGEVIKVYEEGENDLGHRKENLLKDSNNFRKVN